MKRNRPPRSKPRRRSRPFRDRHITRQSRYRDPYLETAEASLRDWTRHPRSIPNHHSNPALYGLRALSRLTKTRPAQTQPPPPPPLHIVNVTSRAVPISVSNYAARALPKSFTNPTQTSMIRFLSPKSMASRSSSLLEKIPSVSPSLGSNFVSRSSLRHGLEQVGHAMATPFRVLSNTSSSLRSWLSSPSLGSKFRGDNPMKNRQMSHLPFVPLTSSYRSYSTLPPLPSSSRRSSIPGNSSSDISLNSTSMQFPSTRSFTSSSSSNQTPMNKSPSSTSTSRKKLSTLADILPKASASSSLPAMTANRAMSSTFMRNLMNPQRLSNTTSSSSSSHVPRTGLSGASSSFRHQNHPGLLSQSSAALMSSPLSSLTSGTAISNGLHHQSQRNIGYLSYLHRRMIDKYNRRLMTRQQQVNKNINTPYSYKPPVQVQTERAKHRLRMLKTPHGARNAGLPTDYRNDFPNY